MVATMPDCLARYAMTAPGNRIENRSMMPMKNFCGSKFMGSTSSVIFNHTYHRERRTLLQGAGPAQPFQERGGNVTLALTGFGNAISRRCGGRRGTHDQADGSRRRD